MLRKLMSRIGEMFDRLPLSKRTDRMDRLSKEAQGDVEGYNARSGL